MKFNEFTNEADNPCWKGYKQIGMKKKGKQEVPNCVPEETDYEKEFDKSPFEVYTPRIEELAGKYAVPVEDVLDQVKKGLQVEAEHTTDFTTALEIALDHIAEKLNYYEELSAVEEADEKKIGEFSKDFYKPLKPSQKSAIERALVPDIKMYMADGYNVILRTAKDDDRGTAVMLYIKKGKGFSQLVAHKSMGPSGKLVDKFNSESLEERSPLTTLNRMTFKSGVYKKALEALNRMMEKYPNKSAYFLAGEIARISGGKVDAHELGAMWDAQNESINENATAGATSASAMATVANPKAARAKVKRGKYGAPEAPQLKNADGTAKNAQDVKNNLMGGATIKR